MAKKLVTIVALCIMMVFGGVLLYADDQVTTLTSSHAFPVYIDPAVGSTFECYRAIVNLYDTLVHPDLEGKPEPHVAETWEASNDGTVWTFQLRQGIPFHDGHELTAEDVKYSIDRMLTIGEGPAHLFLGVIKDVEVVDDYMVRIYLTQSFGPFLSILYKVPILNKEVVEANLKHPGSYGEKGDYGKDFLNYNDAGSGAYKVKEISLGAYLLFERFSDYWGYVAPNAPDQIRMIASTDPTIIRTMMSRRELEISDQWQSIESLTALDNIEGIDIAAYGAGGMFYYMIHTRKPPTDDVHVRKALAWATDYKTLVSKIYPGYTQARGPIPQNLLGYDPDVFQYQFDLDKALEELKKSDYYEDLDEHIIEIHWISEVPAEEKVALLLQATWAQIGIHAEVVRDPWLSVMEYMATEETSPHLVPMFITAEYPDAGSLLDSKYGSDSASTWDQNEWLLDPKYDRMLEEALAIVDQSERAERYSELQDYIIDLCPTLFLCDDIETHAYQSYYVDWPAAKGEAVPVIGYNFEVRFIEVYPEKRKELL